MKLPLIGQKGTDPYFPVNFFFNPSGFNGKPALIGTPGSKLWKNTGLGGEVRGAEEFYGDSYWVTGNKVYKNGSTALTGSLDTSTGNVSISKSSLHLMIVDGMSGYYISSSDTSTLTKITDVDFPANPYSCIYTSLRFLVANGTGFYWGDTDESAIDWDSTNYLSPNGKPNCALGLVEDHNEHFVFGENKTYVYFPDTTLVFSEYTAGLMEYGTAAYNSIAKIDNTIFWLSNDRTVRKVSQYTPLKVSDFSMDEEISLYETVSDAKGFAFTFSGHSFYCLIFPSEGVTWLYNIPLDLWCKWTTRQDMLRHQANCYLYYDGKHLVGSYHNGKIYELDSKTYDDDGDIIRSEKILPVIIDDENDQRITINKLTLYFKMGVGLTTGQGSDPKCLVECSYDGCRTWPSQFWVSMGKIGKYEYGAFRHMLGTHRMVNIKVAVTDPVERVFYGATIE